MPAGQSAARKRDRVASTARRTRARGTFKGELARTQPTGRQTPTPAISILRIENGRIVEEFEVWDQLTMYQELGALASVAAQA